MNTPRLAVVIPGGLTKGHSMNPGVAVVIVNYRSPDLVIDCLRSLEVEVREVGDVEVYVVDNASPDDSVAKLSDAIATNHWNWAQLLPQANNGGFAAGNNAAIKPILSQAKRPKYIWLLNPDTYIRPGALKSLVQFLESHPQAGVAGGLCESPDGSPQVSSFHFPGVLSEIETGMKLGLVSKILKSRMVAPPPRTDTHRTEWVCGASMLTRTAIFNEIGLLDEQYFLYFEEVDWIYRAYRRGWEIWSVGESRIVHLEGYSTGINGENRSLKRRPKYWFDSRERFFRKKGGWAYLQFANLTYAISLMLWRARRWVQRKPDKDPPHFLGDFLRHWRGRMSS